jgi:hypothetical protein
MIIDGETLSLSASNALLHLRNTQAMLLSILDLVFKRGFNLQVCKETTRYNFKIETCEFLMERRLILLDYEIVAIGFPT